jgi:hypothetical protein
MAAAAWIGACEPPTPPPWTDGASYWITSERRSATRHVWRTGVAIARRGDHAVATVPIRLLPDVSIPDGALRTPVAAWEATIEAAWSDRVALRVDGMAPLPLRIDVVFDPPADPVTRVIVLPGSGPADLGAWRLQNPAAVAAHEVGHLLGAWDEYEGGAQDPASPVVDLNHVMGRETTSTTPHPRSYAPLAADLATLLGRAVQIVPLPGETP